MIFLTNDATAKMLKALQENNGKDALANISLMWAELFEKMTPKELSESNSLNGIYLLTKLVQRLNERDGGNGLGVDKEV